MGSPARIPRSSRRGRTRADRLRLLDAFVVHELSKRWRGPLAVADVGYGDCASSTVALHEQLRSAGLDVHTRGIEREPLRVRAAQHAASATLQFREGGFDLAGRGHQELGLVRCANVLRAYPLAEVRAAHAQLGQALAMGGLLVEGTTDTEGHVATAHVWQRHAGGLRYRALLLATDGARGFSPWLLRDYLPRDLRRHVRAPEPVHQLLCDWEQCWQATRKRPPSESFATSVAALSERRTDVPFDAAMTARGIAQWCPDKPSTRPEVFDGTL